MESSDIHHEDNLAKASMLYILTRTNKWWHLEHWKHLARQASRTNRGPRSVYESLARGLKKKNIAYEINSNITTTDSETVLHVISGVQALRDGITMKKRGQISKLIAGPNIVITPTDHDSIITDPTIDTILVPSKWIQDLYALCDPTLVNRTKIWPAGVEIPESSTSEVKSYAFDCLVFKKHIPKAMYANIIDELKKRNTSYQVITYGSYTPADYFDLLSKCRYMIYLQNVESQGLALQEAWARNIPTLVWNPGVFTYPQGYTIHGNICAPYLSEANGAYFKNTEDFPVSLENFIAHLPSFHPREDCIRRLSDEASIEIYTRILDNTIHTPHD